ncbi:TlyA family RNA methyltransferase [Clostridium mediterraneense]|uniref:TlyA family RNA methyltransferase n=1 Tax=Clostridium mediterraneense TaxID=1805472 RepID=UPI000835055E|nr:TlyA family RNA methyltransferase [Clostridium mediterraneense]
MAKKKERLDVILVDKGFFESREQAKRSIMAGEIFVDDKRVDKAGEKIDIEANIEFKGSKQPYVSRGGFKLEKAINSFGIDINGSICMDIGASTGGFTDCMLQNGASKVYSIDVGYGQFAWKLRTDPRVVCLERTNVRYVTDEQVPDKCDFASIDVSFISLTTIMPAVMNLLKEDGEVMALIKPQFEAGKGKVGKKGVVREPEIHKEVIEKIVNYALSNNLNILNIDFSPIKGPEGNIEYLIYLRKSNEKQDDFNFEIIDEVVNNSHSDL